MSSIDDRTDLGGIPLKAWHVRLIERFPSEFRAIHCGDVTTPLAYGFTVGDGWQAVIEAAVIVLNKQNRLKLREDLRINDITTHKGELSIDVSIADDRVRGMVAAASIVSNLVCDVCGASGMPGSVGGRTAKCDEHRNGADAYTTRVLSVFDKDVRAGVAEPVLLAGLTNYEDAVQQCVVALGYFIGATRGRAAESRGVQPRLAGFTLSAERVLEAHFEFDPGEQLRGFVEFCRMYVVICRKQEGLSTDEVRGAHRVRHSISRLNFWFRKLARRAWLLAHHAAERRPSSRQG
jgi:hypothetical protein